MTKRKRGKKNDTLSTEESHPEEHSHAKAEVIVTNDDPFMKQEEVVKK